MAAVLRFEVNENAIRGLAQVGQPVHRWMVVTLARVDAAAKRYLSGSMVKVRTGNLRSSQSSHVENRGSIVVGILENTASYALAVHDGTAPHEIRPRNAKVLTGWSFRGQRVFTPVVHHPGTSARPFLRQALSDVVQHAGESGLSVQDAI